MEQSREQEWPSGGYCAVTLITLADLTRYPDGSIDKKENLSMKKRIYVIPLMILTLALLLTGCSSATGTAVNTWGGAAVADSMVYYASGPQVLALADSGANYTVRWTYPEKAVASRLFMAEPLLVGEKLIAPNADNNVYAVDLNGKLIWTFTKDGAFWARPATDEKLAFIPSLNHFLYAVDVNTGKQAWEVDLKSPLVARPLFADGVVYLGNLTGNFYAINVSDGSIKWTQKVAGGVWAQPILQNGNLYFGDQTGKVNILAAADGKVIAGVDTGSAVLGSGAIVPDGIIFGTESGKVILFDLEGKSKPLLTLEAASIYSNIVVNGDRMVIVAYKGSKPLIALDLNGNEAWYYSTKK